MNIRSRSGFLTSFSMLTGVLLGLFLGYRVLPSVLPRSAPTLAAAELQAIPAISGEELAGIATRGSEET